MAHDPPPEEFVISLCLIVVVIVIHTSLHFDSCLPYSFTVMSLSGELLFPVNISNMFGNICFVERRDSLGRTRWFAGIITGPNDLPFTCLKRICLCMYSNVSCVLFNFQRFVCILLMIFISSTLG